MKSEPSSTTLTLTKELFSTDKSQGLNDSEVKRRQSLFGHNEIVDFKKESWLKTLIVQFKDLMNIILLIISGILFIKVIIEAFNANPSDSMVGLKFLEPIIIIVVVFLNSLLTTYQVMRANQSVASLKNLITPTAKVIRNGNVDLINSVNLVPGDIVILEAGDVVPADCELLESTNLRVTESALTGESVPVKKRVGNNQIGVAPLTLNQSNYVYSSSHIVGGRAVGIVRAIGAFTQVGSISVLVKNTKAPKTPLQIKLDRLAKYFSWSAVGLFCFSFLLQILVQGFSSQITSYMNAIVNAVALAVSAVPEGLVVFSTAVLALNVKEMKKNKVIFKNLQTIEAIGSTSIICTDKTGTLTKNEMKVVNYQSLKHGNFLKQRANPEAFRQEIEWVGLANEALSLNSEEKERKLGDPTELAILEFAQKFGCEKTKLLASKKYEILKIIPFSSERKRMSVVVRDSKKNILLLSKGAFEILLDRSGNAKACQTLIKLNSEWSQKAWRVLGVAVKSLSETELSFLQNPEFSSKEVEKNLEMVGLIALEDPIREEAKIAIQECEQAGIKTIMITGDNKETAKAIAERVGIQHSEKEVITGEELENMDERSFQKQVKNFSVYARVSPKHKLRVVQAWQKLNHVVTMTGDGINDSPALKAADVGCAMGKTGTDVSKESADIVLLDDNFATIVEGVRQGRKVFRKLQNVIKNLLISSVAAIVAVLVGLIILERVISLRGKSTENFYIFNATQILFANLLTHGFPAISLGLIDPKIEVFKEKPRPKNSSILDKKNVISTLLQGSFIGLISIVVWIYAYLTRSSWEDSNSLTVFSSSAAFLTFGLSTVVNALNLLDNKSILRMNKEYKYVYIAVAFSVFAVLVTVFVPGLQVGFGVASQISNLSSVDVVLLALLAAASPTLFMELKKFLKNGKRTRRIKKNN